jgi:nitrite reductase/ring-hydroxylating ferredoxin subunit
MSDISADVKVLKGEIICKINELNNLQAKRFQIRYGDIAPLKSFFADLDDYLPAFILRKDPYLVAYLNRCAHVPMEMDWNLGEFLDENLEFIVCSTHYATYDIQSGACLERAMSSWIRLNPLED